MGALDNLIHTGSIGGGGGSHSAVPTSALDALIKTGNLPKAQSSTPAPSAAPSPAEPQGGPTPAVTPSAIKPPGPFAPGVIKSYPVGPGGVKLNEEGGYGASFKTDAPTAKNSGPQDPQGTQTPSRPLLALTNKQGTVLPDRVAPTFDPTKPQRLTQDMVSNGRMPYAASQDLRRKMGAGKNDELDHAIARELSGSNLPANLQVEPGIKGGLSAEHDKLENQIARDVINGDKTGVSLAEGQRRLAAAKGRTLPEDQAPATPLSKTSSTPPPADTAQPKTPGIIAVTPSQHQATISEAPQLSPIQRFFQALQHPFSSADSPLTQSPTEAKADAMDAYSTFKMVQQKAIEQVARDNNVDPSKIDPAQLEGLPSFDDVFQNTNAYKDAYGIERAPTKEEMAFKGMTLLFAATGVGDLVEAGAIAGEAAAASGGSEATAILKASAKYLGKAGVSLVTFAGLDTAAKKVAGFFAGKQISNFSDLLPQGTNEATRFLVDALGFIGEGLATAGIYKTAPKVADILTKQTLIEYKMPQTVYLDGRQVYKVYAGIETGEQSKLLGSLGLTSEQIKAARTNGISIAVPSEKIVSVTDRPWWGKLKSAIGLDPAEANVTNFTENGGKPAITTRGNLPGPSGLPEEGIASYVPATAALKTPALDKLAGLESNAPAEIPKTNAATGNAESIKLPEGDVQVPDAVKSLRQAGYSTEDVKSILTPLHVDQASGNLNEKIPATEIIKSAATFDANPAKESGNSSEPFTPFSPAENQNLDLEKKALQSAKIGAGEFKVGEVYKQEVAGGTRPVQITKVNSDGSVEGWYLGSASKTEKEFGLGEASLSPAKWKNPATDLKPMTIPQARLEEYIGKTFGTGKPATSGNAAPLPSPTATTPPGQKSPKIATPPAGEGSERQPVVGAPNADAKAQIAEFNRDGFAVSKGAKVTTVPLSSFNGPEPKIFPNQVTVTTKGVRQWMDRIEAGERPSILVRYEPRTNDVRVVDGHHRLKAYENLGIKNIPVIDDTFGKLKTEPVESGKENPATSEKKKIAESPKAESKKESLPDTKKAAIVSPAALKEKPSAKAEVKPAIEKGTGKSIAESVKAAKEARIEIGNKITAKTEELREAYKDNEDVHQALQDVLTQLEISEPGSRFSRELPDTYDREYIGIPSTFPSWVPEDLRDTQLFKKVFAGLNDPAGIQYPDGIAATRQRALYDEIFDHLDRELGLDTKGIRRDILSLYDQRQTVASGKEIVAEENKRGVAGSEGRGRIPASSLEGRTGGRTLQPSQVSDLADFVVGKKKDFDTLMKKSGQLESRIALNRERAPYISQQDRGEIQRGVEQVLARLRADTAFGMSAQRRLDGAGAANASDYNALRDKAELAIPREQIDTISHFIDEIGPSLLSDVGISIFKRGGKQGQYDFSNSLISIFKDNVLSSGGHFDKTVIHELWHSLSRYLPEGDIAGARRQYLRDVEAYAKKNPWIREVFDRKQEEVPSFISDAKYKALIEKFPEAKKYFAPDYGFGASVPEWRIRFGDDTYRLKNIDEWFAENLTDKSLAHFENMNQRTRSIFGFLKDILRAMVNGVKRFFGADKVGKIFEDFMEGKNDEIQREGNLRGTFASALKEDDFRIGEGEVIPGSKDFDFLLEDEHGFTHDLAPAGEQEASKIDPESGKVFERLNAERLKKLVSMQVDKAAQLAAFKDTELSAIRGKAFVPALKDAFNDWVNQRGTSKLEGKFKEKEFAKKFESLDKKGIAGIIEYQKNKDTENSEFAVIKKFFDDKFKEANDAGVTMGYKPEWSKRNYLPQLWSNSQEEIEAAFGKKLGLRPGFTMQSVIRDYEEGVSRGLTPKYTKLSELAGWYEARANKAIADRNFFDFVAQNGFIQPANQAPQGWLTVNGDHFPLHKVKIQKFKLNATRIPGEGNYHMDEYDIYDGAYKAPPNLAKAINNYLEPQTGPMAQIAKITTTMKGILLASGIPGTGFNFHGFSILARTALAGDNPITATGKALMYYTVPSTAQKAFDLHSDRAIFFSRHGLTFSVEDKALANTVQSMFKNPTYLAAKAKFLPAKNFLHHWFSDPLFQKVIPTLKLNKAEEIYRSLVKAGYKSADAARIASKQSNEFFGGLNLDVLMRSKETQNFFRMMVFAPDFQEGGIRIGAGMVKSIMNPRNPEYHAYRVFARNLLMAYIALNIANKAVSGHYMFQNEDGHKFDIAVGHDANGKIRWFRPFSSAVDFIRVPVDAASAIASGDTQTLYNIIRNRLSVPLGTLETITTGKDALGNDIYDPTRGALGNVESGAVQVGGMVLPQPAMAGINYLRGQIDAEQGISQALGFPLRYTKNTLADNNIASLIYDQRPKLEARIKDLYLAGATKDAYQVMSDYNTALMQNAVKAYQARNMPVPETGDLMKLLSKYFIRPPTQKSLDTRVQNKGKGTFHNVLNPTP